MINKLTRFATFAAFAAALTTVGCARQEAVSTPPVVPSSPPIVVRAPKVAPVREWSISSPGWKLVEETPLEGEDPQIVAVFENTLSDDLTARGQIIAQPLTTEGADTFYADMEEAATTRDPETVKVLATRKTKRGPFDVFEVLELRRVEGGVIVVLSVALSDGKVGYLVMCGGDAEEGEAILDACKPFVRSFRIGK